MSFQLIPQIPGILNKEFSTDVIKAYVESFKKANATFLHQGIFDVSTLEQRPLQPYPTDGDYSYAGIVRPKEIALPLSLGNVNCTKMEVIRNFNSLENVRLISIVLQIKNILKSYQVI